MGYGLRVEGRAFNATAGSSIPMATLNITNGAGRSDESHSEDGRNHGKRIRGMTLSGWWLDVCTTTLSMRLVLKLRCGLRFLPIRRKIFEEVPLESTTGTICLEMVKKFQDLGYRFAEVPVNHYYRSYGRSQFFRWKHLWRTFRQLYALWWKLVVKKEHLAGTVEPDGLDPHT